MSKRERGQMWIQPRPLGFDYNQPDLMADRCLVCNPDGMCRTGNVSVGYVGSLTNTDWAAPCPARCQKGLRREQALSTR